MRCGNTTDQEFKGNGKLSAVVVKDMVTEEVEEVNLGAAFIFIGLDPNTAFVKDDVAVDRFGFIQTGQNMETSIPGVFAAGDARGAALSRSPAPSVKGIAQP